MSSMTATESPAPLRRRRRRRRVSIVGVLGELFITAGVFVLLFLGWQLWLNDIIVGNQQQEVAEELQEEWAAQQGELPAKTPPNPGEPVVTAKVESDQPFATLIVPRLAEAAGTEYYSRVIAEGVGNAVLNSNRLGIGHYSKTQMPGEVGNFALGAHRSAYGGAFHNLHQLHVGDSIYVETQDGWYKYVFRGLEYVAPTGVGVLDPVPQNPGAQPGERIITLTTCNPFFSTAERLIAYGVYEAWYPRTSAPDQGAPPEIAEQIITQATGGE